VHLLGFVDDEDGADQRRLDMGLPLLSDRLESSPAVARRERDAEESPSSR